MAPERCRLAEEATGLPYSLTQLPQLIDVLLPEVSHFVIRRIGRGSWQATLPSAHIHGVPRLLFCSGREGIAACKRSGNECTLRLRDSEGQRLCRLADKREG